jgi:hypothetical protein
MLDLTRLVLEILGAVLLLLTCIFSFLHAKRGQDVAGITFGMGFLVLLISKIVLIWLYVNTGLQNIAGSHVNAYIWWYTAFSYIPFSIACFTSIFTSGKLSSIVWAPVVLLMGAAAALPFIESLFPVIAPFSQHGGFIWLVAAVFILAASMMYFFYNYKASDRFRLWMGIGFALVSVSLLLRIFSGTEGLFRFMAIASEFAGLFIIFYEVTYA